jgi:hypothetical protein
VVGDDCTNQVLTTLVSLPCRCLAWLGKGTLLIAFTGSDSHSDMLAEFEIVEEGNRMVAKCIGEQISSPLWLRRTWISRGCHYFLTIRANELQGK